MMHGQQNVKFNLYVFHHLIVNKLNLVVFCLYWYLCHIVILFNTTQLPHLKFPEFNF